METTATERMKNLKEKGAENGQERDIEYDQTHTKKQKTTKKMDNTHATVIITHQTGSILLGS